MTDKINNNGRVAKSIKNTIYGMGSYLIILLVTFGSRKIFADTLGAEFLGLNNYFLSVISMLSLTEMGIGTAMLYFLYKPLGMKDYEKIKSLMQYYKRIYTAIGLTITILGLLVSIFIVDFVDSSIPDKEVRLYFILFLIGTTVTYLWAHKKNILYADQKSAIISTIRTLSKVIVIILQTIVLFSTGSFSLYLLLIIIGNIADNLVCNIIVNKQYPYLLDKKVVPVSKEQKKDLLNKVVPIFTYNIADYSVTSVPIIVISTISLSISGLYSNYILITTTLRAILGSIFASFTFSFGNLAALESKEKCFAVYKKIDSLAFWIITTTTVTYISMIQPFISLWLGESFQLTFINSILIGINFYCVMMNVPIVSVQNALGLHRHDQTASIFYAIFSIILSIILGIYYGINGVVLANIISILAFPTVTKPFVIYKYAFSISPLMYYVEFAKRFVLLIIITAGTVYSANLIFVDISIISFIIRGVYSVLIPMGLLMIFYYRTEEFRYYTNIVRKFLGR